MSEVKKEKEKKKTVKKKETKEEVVKETKVKTTRGRAKKKEVLLNKSDQEKYHIISKIVRILAKVGRVCLMIFVPFIVLSMFLIPLIFKNFDVSANIIKFGNASIIIRDDGLTFKIGNNIRILDCDSSVVDRITDFLSNNDKGYIVASVELSLLFFSVLLILDIYLLTYIEKLFYNFETGKSPFNEDNSKYILLIAKLFIAIKVCGICMSLIGLFRNTLISISLIEILAAFVSYYIFKYAAGVQDKVETSIYD